MEAEPTTGLAQSPWIGGGEFWLPARASMSWQHYVYEILTPTGRVIYVGKGSGKRCLVSARERGGVAQIVAHFKHSEWALQFERERIAERLAEGLALKNVSHGHAVPWHKRTDTQAMARELLEWVAHRVQPWIRAGMVLELARIVRIPADDLVALHQRFGV